MIYWAYLVLSFRQKFCSIYYVRFCDKTLTQNIYTTQDTCKRIRHLNMEHQHFINNLIIWNTTPTVVGYTNLVLQLNKERSNTQVCILKSHWNVSLYITELSTNKNLPWYSSEWQILRQWSNHGNYVLTCISELDLKLKKWSKLLRTKMTNFISI